MKKLLLTAAIGMMAAYGYSQENVVTVDAQLRTRGEHNNGAITPHKDGQQASNFINERARLSMDFKRQNLELKASVQHTGVWGQDDIKQPNGRATMNEAWAKLTFADNFFAKLGRQQLSYDDERILGALDWNVNGNWHDALKLGYQDFYNQVHLILAMNQEKENNHGDYYSGPMPYKNMQTLWYHYQSDMLPLGVSVLAMNLGREVGTEGHGRTNYLQTLGTDINFKPMDWRLHAAFYYQMGKNLTTRKVSAWMASVKAEYDIDPMLSVYAGYDYLSGNDGSVKMKAFNALYGTHHKFYGAMDFFPGTISSGLQDIQAGASSKPLDWLSVKLDYHYFLAAEQVSTLGKAYGHEIDLQATAKIAKDVTLMGGFSTMFGTEVMDYMRGGNHKKFQDWAWIQLNIAPRVLFTKW